LLKILERLLIYQKILTKATITPQRKLKVRLLFAKLQTHIHQMINNIINKKRVLMMIREEMIHTLPQIILLRKLKAIIIRIRVVLIKNMAKITMNKIGNTIKVRMMVITINNMMSIQFKPMEIEQKTEEEEGVPIMPEDEEG
jgi:hypothetical protein